MTRSTVQHFDIYRTGPYQADDSERLVSTHANYLSGAGPSHPNEFTDYNHDVEARTYSPCSMCEAINTLANDATLYSVTAHEGLYEVRRRKE